MILHLISWILQSLFCGRISYFCEVNLNHQKVLKLLNNDADATRGRKSKTLITGAHRPDYDIAMVHNELSLWEIPSISSQWGT